MTTPQKRSVLIHFSPEAFVLLDIYCPRGANGAREGQSQLLSQLLIEHHQRQTTPPVPRSQQPMDALPTCATPQDHMERLERDTYCPTEVHHARRMERHRHLAWMAPDDVG